VLEDRDVEPVDSERFKAFSSFLEIVRERAFRLSIPELLELLYIDGGYKAYLSSNDDRRIFEEHYDYLYSYAVQYEAEGRGLSDYARFLRNTLGKADKLPETSVLKRERSGVQIMTVHKSKGLEFKVVIFAGIGGTNQNDKDSYVFEYNGNLIASENRGVQKLLEKDRKDRELAELKRVMYVALTRAKDHLILVGGYKVNKGGDISSGDVLKWYMDAVGADVSTHTCANSDVTIEDISKTRRMAWTPSVDSCLKAADPSCFTGFKSRATRMGVTDLKRLRKTDDGSDSCVELKRYAVDSILGTANLHDKFGTLCHQVLEHLLRFGSYDDVECHVCDADSDNSLLLGQARGFADSFIRSEFFSKHVKGRKTLEELRFYTFDEELPDVALEGVIDLLVLGDGYNLVVDYKSDSIRNPEEHRMQILAYIKVAEQIYGKRCYGTLYYLRDGSLGGFWDKKGNPVSPEAL
ncbi:MAG: PD-(D/E)XK nuclease family protein, partial [Spirochaetales bacterium]|nr:PD-(D/E)XK nuclease family protein [Spirochaetales bacterium]